MCIHTTIYYCLLQIYQHRQYMIRQTFALFVRLYIKIVSCSLHQNESFYIHIFEIPAAVMLIIHNQNCTIKIVLAR